MTDAPKRPPTSGTRKGNGAGMGAGYGGPAKGAGKPAKRPAFQVANIFGQGMTATEKSIARAELAQKMLEIQVHIAISGENENARIRASEVVQERMIGKVPNINKNENSGPDGEPLEIAVIRRVIVDSRNSDT